MTPKLILASNSPRRRQLLALTGWVFDVRPVDIDESPLPGEAPDRYVMRLAGDKARATSLIAQPDELILTADTTVADGDRIMGKPVDAADARDMLRSLRGRAHTVYTAIGVIQSRASHPVIDLCGTLVWMRDYTDEEIEDYIDSGDPFDKAGAYAIQNTCFAPVERLEGCYACVVGLPICHVVRALTPFGLHTHSPITATCPDVLQANSPCPAADTILRERME